MKKYVTYFVHPVWFFCFAYLFRPKTWGNGNLAAYIISNKFIHNIYIYIYISIFSSEILWYISATTCPCCHYNMLQCLYGTLQLQLVTMIHYSYMITYSYNLLLRCVTATIRYSYNFSWGYIYNLSLWIDTLHLQLVTMMHYSYNLSLWYVTAMTCLTQIKKWNSLIIVSQEYAGEETDLVLGVCSADCPEHHHLSLRPFPFPSHPPFFSHTWLHSVWCFLQLI